MLHRAEDSSASAKKENWEAEQQPKRRVKCERRTMQFRIENVGIRTRLNDGKQANKKSTVMVGSECVVCTIFDKSVLKIRAISEQEDISTC